MARVVLSPSQETEDSIKSLFARADVSSIVVDVFSVNDYLGNFLQMSAAKDEDPYYLVGKTSLARELREMGVKSGDQMLVARHPYRSREASVYLVSPLTEANRQLAGKTLTA